MDMAAPKVLIMMADYGHEPTEAAVPYAAFKKAGFEVSFATEHGEPPVCDRRLLEGITQKLLGAKKSTIAAYRDMTASPECRTPLAWTGEGFSLAPFDCVYLPGGHDKAVRQLLDSRQAQALLAAYFPLTRKRPSPTPTPSPGSSPPGKAKVVAAICHGPLALARAEDGGGRSVLWGCATTALPRRFEQLAFWATRAFLGDYYKTYGDGSACVEDLVRGCLAEPERQFRCSLSPLPFVVEDDEYNYVSARFPGDVDLFSERVVRLVQSLNKE